MNRIYIIWPMTLLLIAMAIGCGRTNPVGKYVYVTEIKYGTKTMDVEIGYTLDLNANGTYITQVAPYSNDVNVLLIRSD